jgi:hypothetical protein
MDHDGIVEQLRDPCKGFIEHIVQRVTGLEWSSCGAQVILDHTATDHAQWRTDTVAPGNETVAELV